MSAPRRCAGPQRGAPGELRPAEIRLAEVRVLPTDCILSIHSRCPPFLENGELFWIGHGTNTTINTAGLGSAPLYGTRNGTLLESVPLGVTT
jgi:hypothetical protein